MSVASKTPFKGKRVTVAQKFAWAEKSKNIPESMSNREKIRLLDLAKKLEKEGKEEEALRTRRQVPLAWPLAMTVIEMRGSAELLSMGWNLTDAIAVMGEEFVYGE